MDLPFRLNRSLAQTLHRCRKRGRERDGERDRETIGSGEQHSTSVSMAVALIFTNETQRRGEKRESNGARARDKE